MDSLSDRATSQIESLGRVSTVYMNDTHQRNNILYDYRMTEGYEFLHLNGFSKFSGGNL